MDPFEYLESRGYFNIDPGLDRIEKVLRRSNDPHLSIPAVHIGGTNGKGSTSAMVEALMREFPVRTGLYTSPHLVSILERLRIDGSDIDMQTLGTGLTKALSFDPQGGLTYFELLTAASYLVMGEMGVDVNISEVGMGGRWDATNILEPQAIAITSISMDHMEYLGNDPVSITIEKCGIIKPSTPVVVGEVCSLMPESERCLRTILDHCTHNGCPVVLMSNRSSVERKKELLSSYNIPKWRIVSVEPEARTDSTGAEFHIIRPPEDGMAENRFALLDGTLEGYFEVPLLGGHQAFNMGVAVCLAMLVLPFALSHSRLRRGDVEALSTLISGGTDWVVREYPSPRLREMVRNGLGSVSIRGRMDRLMNDGKEIFIDGGHNVEAARSISLALRAVRPGTKVVLLFAMMKDKEVSEFLHNLDIPVDSIILTTLPYDRSMQTGELLRGLVRSGLVSRSIHIRNDVGSAVSLWRELIGDGQIGLATGSFYLYRFATGTQGCQKV